MLVEGGADPTSRVTARQPDRDAGLFRHAAHTGRDGRLVSSLGGRRWYEDGDDGSHGEPRLRRAIPQGRSPIGLHVSGGLDMIVKNRHVFNAVPSRIVGIVGNAREDGPDREPIPTVYTCFSAPHPAPWHLVRTAGDPAAAAEVVRRAIFAIEPARSVYEVASLEQRMGDAYAQNRLRTWLLSLFAITALTLVCAGVYGTLSYAVSLRRREVALRLALGALRRSLVRRSVYASCASSASLQARTVALDWRCFFTRSLSTMLYGVTPKDPATLIGVLVLVVSVAAVAAVIPATRAAFMPPMRALRED